MTPTIFHVTHWKAGSQWVRAVLEDAAAKRIVRGEHDLAFRQGGITNGGIYTPVYADYGKFLNATSGIANARPFFVMRDPRDTAVSWYFSLRYSHTTKDATVRESRELLRRISQADGLALVISNHLRDAVKMQRSWIESGRPLFRYEDLVADQQTEFKRIFDYCELDTPEKLRRRIVDRHSFARKTWWRFGREDRKSHLRKGVAGEWRSHFCDRLKKLFKIQHNTILVQAGYERDEAW